jgi:neutral ceramidase
MLKCLFCCVTAGLLFLAQPLPGGEFKAGVARRDVTPPKGGKLYGYGARGDDVSTGVHDPLYAKAVVMSDGNVRLAIVTLDLGSMPAANTTRLREAIVRPTGIDQVLLVASHTHSAPAFAADFSMTGRSYVAWMEQQVVDAVLDANEELKPAQVGAGWGQVAEGHNRRLVNDDGSVTMLWGNRDRRPTSPVDHSLGVIAVDRTDGTPMATLFNFACHPVVLGPENLELSADWPGAMMAYLEDRVGGQAMFLQGAAGDINPFWDKTAPEDGGFEQVEKMGIAVAVEAQRVRDGIDQWEKNPELNIAQQRFALELRWNPDDPDARKSANADFARILQYYLDGFAKEKSAEVNTILIGERIALATFPGEFFVEHGLRLKSTSVIQNTFFVGYTNGAVGYFPTIRAAAEGGYGATSATVVTVGTGEMLVNRALVKLHQQAGLLKSLPD